MGKFDKRLKGEKAGERKAPGLRAKHTSATDVATERTTSANVMTKVLKCGPDWGMVGACSCAAQSLLPERTRPTLWLFTS